MQGLLRNDSWRSVTCSLTSPRRVAVGLFSGCRDQWPGARSSKEVLSQLRSAELVGDTVLSAEVCVKSELRQEAGGLRFAGQAFVFRRSVRDSLTNGSCPEEVTEEMAVGSRTARAHGSNLETVGGCGVIGARGLAAQHGHRACQ